MCQEKLKANATEAIFPSLQRRGRKQPDHMIETDDVKSTAVRKYRASSPIQLPYSPTRTGKDSKLVRQIDHLSSKMSPDTEAQMDYIPISQGL